MHLKKKHIKMSKRYECECTYLFFKDMMDRGKGVTQMTVSKMIQDDLTNTSSCASSTY